MSTENETETELRTAADFIQEAARYVNWTPDEKHPQQARYDALTALNSFHAYSTAVALETLRRVAPDAAQRVAEHLSEDMYWDINHENSWAWEQALAAGQPIPADAWPFPQITGQPAGEHHTGTLNLTGEGNTPEPVLYWCPTARQIEMQPGGGFDTCCHAAELHEPVLAVVYAAIRQQVAEQIAVTTDEFLGQPAGPVAAEIARRIGRGESL